MLALSATNAIVESGYNTAAAQQNMCGGNYNQNGYYGQTTNCWPYYGYPIQTQIYWQSYPIYVCTDKTKKAIDVLKALEADGLKVTSVTKFIALVEKIAAIL
jgi:hypothetical protein